MGLHKRQTERRACSQFFSKVLAAKPGKAQPATGVDSGHPSNRHISLRQTYLSLRQTYVSLRQRYAFARLSKNHRILTELIPYKSRWEILFQQVASGCGEPFQHNGSSDNMFREFFFRTMLKSECWGYTKHNIIISPHSYRATASST